MDKLIKRIQLGIFAAGLLILPAAKATQLITEDEAKLPPPKGAIAADRRGILRGPKVEVVSPNEASHSPLRLQLKFESFGGARINIEFGEGDLSSHAECRPDSRASSRSSRLTASICRIPNCLRANTW